MATVGHEALPTMSESLWVTKFGISGHYLTNVIFQYGGCWGPTCDLSLQQCERTPGNEFIHLHVQVNYVPLERLNAEARNIALAHGQCIHVLHTSQHLWNNGQ